MGSKVKFYPFYTGDYTRDTLELDAAEDGIYVRLLNYYYSNERPIPDDRAISIARVTSEDEIKKTHWVLSRFFKREQSDGDPTGSVWRNERCDLEIKKANKRINAAILNGKKGGRPKKEKPSGLAKQNPTLNPVETQWQTSPDPDPDLDLDLKKKRSPLSPPLGDKRKKGTQIADDWKPNTQHQELARDLGIPILHEVEKFRDHALANGRVLKNWNAGFRNWLRQSKDFCGNGNGNGQETKASAMVRRTRESCVAFAAGDDQLSFVEEKNDGTSNNRQDTDNDIRVVPRKI